MFFKLLKQKLVNTAVLKVLQGKIYSTAVGVVCDTQGGHHLERKRKQSVLTVTFFLVLVLCIHVSVYAW